MQAEISIGDGFTKIILKFWILFNDYFVVHKSAWFFSKRYKRVASFFLKFFIE